MIKLSGKKVLYLGFIFKSNNMLPTGTHCLHPKWIESHGRRYRIPCGHCEACLTVKQSSYELRTEIEASKFRYCYMITLTYNSYHLPLASLHKVCYQDVLNNDKYYYLICTKIRRSRNYYQRRKLPVNRNGVVLGRINIDHHVNEDYLDMLSIKVRHNRKIPFLNFDDVQKFNKRVRKNLSKLSYEKIKVLSCGEYGPVSFRPHFHCLYLFNDSKIAKNLFKIVRTSWTYGRIDVQASRGSCGSYVSGYLTSSSCLPRFYTTCSFKPFIRCSKLFGSSICEDQKKELFETLPFSTPYKSYTFNGRTLEIRIPRQDCLRLFPKVREHANLTTQQLNRRLSLYMSLSHAYGLVSVTDIANEHILHSKEYSHDTLEQLKRDLYISKRFCKNFDYRSDLLIDSINKYHTYYNRLEIDKLRDFYESQIEWYDRTQDPNIYSLFYDNHDSFASVSPQSIPTLEYWDITPDNYKWYSEYKSKVHQHYLDSIKHKKLNDFNKVFFYE